MLWHRGTQGTGSATSEEAIYKISPPQSSLNRPLNYKDRAGLRCGPVCLPVGDSAESAGLCAQASSQSHLTPLFRAKS